MLQRNLMGVLLYYLLTSLLALTMFLLDEHFLFRNFIKPEAAVGNNIVAAIIKPI